jgi:hypothetical protein
MPDTYDETLPHETVLSHALGEIQIAMPSRDFLDDEHGKILPIDLHFLKRKQ